MVCIVVLVEGRTGFVVVLAKIVVHSVLEAATVVVAVGDVFGLYATVTTLPVLDDVALGLKGREEDEDTLVACSKENICFVAGVLAEVRVVFIVVAAPTMSTWLGTPWHV